MTSTLRGRAAATTALGLLASAVLSAWVAASWAATAEIRSIDTLLTGAASSFKVRSAERGNFVLREYNSIAISVVSKSTGQTQAVGANLEGRMLTVPSLSWQEATTVCGHPKTLYTDVGPVRLAARCVPRQGAVVVAATMLTEVQARNWQVRLLAVGLAMVIALIGYVIAWNALRRLLDPLSALARSASKIGHGELDVPIPAMPQLDELAELASAMTYMADGLTRKISDLERSAVGMRNLVSMTSHEVRTPLTVIQGYAQLLAGPLKEVPTARDAAVTRILVECQRIDALIARILASQGSHDHTRGGAEAIDLAAAVGEVLADLAVLRPDIDVQMLPSDVTIWGSSDDLTRALGNLVQNIARHTRDGATVAVTIESDGEWACIVVSDNGPGITNDRLVLIRQSMASHTPVPSERGMGLGLIILHSAITDMGGSVSIESSTAGTTTTLRVPTGAGTSTGQ